MHAGSYHFSFPRYGKQVGIFGFNFVKAQQTINKNKL